MPLTFTEVKTPFNNMSFTPDVPSSALGAGEYNSGKNIETDTRGVRSVLGDERILSQIPGTCIFVSGGYRGNNEYWYIVANNLGRWYAVTDSGITVVTPGSGADPTVTLPGYSDDIAITDAWNGNVLFINDGVNPPMYLLAAATEFYQYDAAPDNYVWNYNPDWSSLTASFMRMYSTPNVGSILIAGNLTADVISTGLTENYPATVRWSQAFGLNSGPETWAPTTTNVANELEVPVRGPLIDGFPLNGNFYVCSYWDTVVFSPISYQSTLAPVLGVRLLTQGRGLLNENCWANADTQVFGLDARDIWVFDGNNFKSLGNQRVKDYFYANLNPVYSNRTFCINNTSKNQIEFYYPDLNSTGWCNKMLAYRYDLDVFQAPRDVSSASHAAEGPYYGVLPDDSTEAFQEATRTVVYSQGINNQYLVQKDQGTAFLDNAPIVSEFRRDNISLGLKYSQQALLHRILPEVINIDTDGLQINGVGNLVVTVGGADSVGQDPTFKPAVTMAINTSDPWTQINQNAFRVNSIKLGNSSTTDTWQCTAVNWQFTPTEDSR